MLLQSDVPLEQPPPRAMSAPARSAEAAAAACKHHDPFRLLLPLALIACDGEYS